MQLVLQLQRKTLAFQLDPVHSFIYSLEGGGHGYEQGPHKLRTDEPFACQRMHLRLVRCVQAIATVMESNASSVEIQSRAVWVVYRLVLSSSAAAVKERIAASAAFEALITAAQAFPDARGLQCNCSNTFICLAFNSEQSTAKIAEKGDALAVTAFRLGRREGSAMVIRASVRELNTPLWAV